MTEIKRRVEVDRSQCWPALHYTALHIALKSIQPVSLSININQSKLHVIIKGYYTHELRETYILA